jgi:XapX domain-containing protein
MKPYLLSLGAGLVVGIVYHLLNVRSPAPPVVALVGLLGILLGEQVVPIAKRIAGGKLDTATMTSVSASPSPNLQPSDGPGDDV